jgi:hypothetical protein
VHVQPPGSLSVTGASVFALMLLYWTFSASAKLLRFLPIICTSLPRRPAYSIAMPGSTHSSSRYSAAKASLVEQNQFRVVGADPREIGERCSDRSNQIRLSLHTFSLVIDEMRIADSGMVGIPEV